MPVGVPKAGFRRSKKYWEKVIDQRSVEDIEADLRAKVPRFIEELEKRTKSIPCPHCGGKVDVIDKDVLFFLIDHAIGKPTQKTELDITQTLVFNADQLDTIIRNNLPQVVQAYESEIRKILGDYEGKKLLPVSNPSNTD